MKPHIDRLKDRVVDVVNEMIHLSHPFKMDEFNLQVKTKDVTALRRAENWTVELGIANAGKPNEGISTLSLIATITDILTGDRLAFQEDEEGFVVGACWYSKGGLRNDY